MGRGIKQILGAFLIGISLPCLIWALLGGPFGIFIGLFFGLVYGTPFVVAFILIYCVFHAWIERHRGYLCLVLPLVVTATVGVVVFLVLGGWGALAIFAGPIFLSASIASFVFWRWNSGKNLLPQSNIKVALVRDRDF